MNDNERRFEQDPKLKASSKFSKDLKALFRPGSSVPPEVDRAVADQAYRHFSRMRRRPWIFRWSAAAATAAAVIIIALTTHMATKPRPAPLDSVIARADIDHNGKVNILDAFRLALQVESGKKLSAKLDINGDGKINHDDVDYVASAAVRLDKRVL